MKFQKGDGVKVIADEKRLDAIGIGKKSVGKFGKIKRILTTCHLPYRVEFIDNCDLWFAEQDLELVEQNNKPEIRKFDTGATRDTLEDKLDYVKALCPLVLRRYVQYLDKHRLQPDGSMRSFNNWKKGIPRETYHSSKGRHFFADWLLEEGYEVSDNHGPVDEEDVLCGELFNTMGKLREILKSKINVQPFVVPKGWVIKCNNIKSCGWYIECLNPLSYLWKDNTLHPTSTGYAMFEKLFRCEPKFGEAPGYWPTEEAAKGALKQYLEKQI